MTAALRYEVVRIRTIASSYWLTALAVVFSAGIAVILALVVNAAQDATARNGEDLGHLASAQVFTTWIVTAGCSGPAMPVVAALFFAVMGAMAMGHEYRYGTNKATLLALPDRYTVIAAKAMVLSAWVAAVSVVILIVNLVIAKLMVSSSALGSESIRPMVLYVVYCVGFALAGMFLATVMRSQVGAIVTALVWPLAVEPIAFTILRLAAGHGDAWLGKVVNLLPASAGRRTMFLPYNAFATLDVPGVHIWGLAGSMFVYVGGVAILLATAVTLFFRRDA